MSYLNEALKKLEQRIKEDLTVAILGRVRKISEKGVNIQPLMKNRDTGENYPLLIDLPVAVNAGIAVDDIVVVIFCDYDIGRALETGEPHRPISSRKHDISDGIVLGKVAFTATTPGQTVEETVVVDIREEGTQLQKKTKTYTYTEGILTAVGVESDWLNA